MHNETDFGTPIRLATRQELLLEFTDRESVSAFALHMDYSERRPGEMSFLTRHSFQDTTVLCDLLRGVIANLETPRSAEAE